MNLSMDLINGISLGIEYVEAIPEDGIDYTVIVDLLIFRLLFQWPIT